jgi:hypothetical protein
MFVFALGLTLTVAGLVPAYAGAQGAGKVMCRVSTPRTARCTSRGGKTAGSARATRATSVAGGALAQTLIFGGGDEATDDIQADEPITELENILTGAGYAVDVSTKLPRSLVQYKAVWFLDTNGLDSNEESELEAFVNAGHGLYLTGERPCCVALDTADSAVINALVAGGGVQAGGANDADDGSAPESVNTTAPDDVAMNPNVLTTWTPNDPGSMSGVAPAQTLTSTTFDNVTMPTGAVWDGSSMVSGQGRLAVLMDINWLETQFWDPTTAPEMAVNLERFLLSDLPVPVEKSASWSGYAANAQGVSEVQGEWTIPTAECDAVSHPSAA